MPIDIADKHAHTVLIVGASRGIGHAMAGEFLARGWNVIGTVRGTARTPLHDLSDQWHDKQSSAHNGLEIASLDMNEPDEVAALRDRLAGRRIDMLFVNAGTANRHRGETIATIATDEFVRVMVTNALSPLRVIEALNGLVPADGLIGVMSSGQGSITNNQNGREEIYRGSKAALNMLMRSYAARHVDDPHALVLLAPGWIRTALGGPSATFSLEETVPAIVTTLLSQLGKRGLQYIDRTGKIVPW